MNLIKSVLTFGFTANRTLKEQLKLLDKNYTILKLQRKRHPVRLQTNNDKRIFSR